MNPSLAHSSFPSSPPETPEMRFNRKRLPRGWGRRIFVGASLIALVAMWAVVPAPARAALTCDFCHKPIQGRYVVYTDHDGVKWTICAACDAKYPHCQLCGMPFREKPVIVGGEVLCPRCAKDAITCSVCGRLIRGPYTVFKSGDKQWAVCPQCKATAPRCVACGRPLRADEVVRIGGKVFCQDCARTLPRCEACGQPIVGTRYMIRFRPGEFCQTCWNTLPVCSMCGAPCGKGSTRLPDGRILCPRCSKDPLEDMATLQRIYDKVKPMLEKELGRPLKHKVRLRLVEPNEIDRMPPGSKIEGAAAVDSPPLQQTSKPPEGDIRRIDLSNGRGSNNRELGKFVRKGDDFEIRILSGQPNDWAWETVAHEFAHAWQSEYNPNLNDSAWEEGFAQWAAELVLHNLGKDDQSERLRLRDDFYGQAYRIVNHYETLRGKKGVIYAVLTMTNKPR